MTEQEIKELQNENRRLASDVRQLMRDNAELVEFSKQSFAPHIQSEKANNDKRAAQLKLEEKALDDYKAILRLVDTNDFIYTEWNKFKKLMEIANDPNSNEKIVLLSDPSIINTDIGDIALQKEIQRLKSELASKEAEIETINLNFDYITSQLSDDTSFQEREKNLMEQELQISLREKEINDIKQSSFFYRVLMTTIGKYPSLETAWQEFIIRVQQTCNETEARDLFYAKIIL